MMSTEQGVRPRSQHRRRSMAELKLNIGLTNSEGLVRVEGAAVEL